MKKTIKYLILPLIFFASFGIVKADIVLNQADYSQTSEDGYQGGGYWHTGYQPIDLNTLTGSYPTSSVLTWNVKTDRNIGVLWSSSGGDQSFIYKTNPTWNNFTKILTWQSYNDMSGFTKLAFDVQAGHLFVYGTLDSATTTGLAQFGWGGTGGGEDTLIRSIYINIDVASSTPESSAISFYFPTSTTPLTRDFSAWYLNVSSTSGGQVYVYYGKYGSTVLTLYDKTSYSPFVSVNPLLIPKSNLLWHPPLIATTTHWQADAYLFLGDTILASSSMDFYINPTATSVPYSVIPKLIQDKIGFDPLTLSTSTTFITETCADFEFFSSSTLSSIACYSRNFIKDLGNSFNDIATGFAETLANTIKKVFPISTFSHVKDIFDQVQPSDAPDIILSSTNPDVFGGRSYTIFTSTTMETASQNVGFNYRDLFSKIMYAGTGILIILQTLLVIKLLKNEKRNNA